MFHRALQFLSRIGDEIHFESFASGLCLSVVNSRKTAYGSIKFEIDFFMEYEDDLGKEDETQCKVSIKTILPLFRSLNQVSKIFFFFIKYKQNLRIEIISRSNKAQYVWIPRVPSSCFSLSAGRNSPKHILSQFLTFQDLMNWWFPKISAISKLICLSSFW